MGEHDGFAQLLHNQVEVVGLAQELGAAKRSTAMLVLPR